MSDVASEVVASPCRLSSPPAPNTHSRANLSFPTHDLLVAATTHAGRFRRAPEHAHELPKLRPSLPSNQIRASRHAPSPAARVSSASLFFAKIHHNRRWRGRSSQDPPPTLPSSPWRGDGDDDRRVLPFSRRRRRRGAPSRRPCPARGGGGAYLAAGPALLKEDGAGGICSSAPRATKKSPSPPFPIVCTWNLFHEASGGDVN